MEREEILLKKESEANVNLENDKTKAYSIAIKRMGHVDKTCKINKWAVNQFVNYCIDFVCLTLYPTGVASDSYNEILKKANSFKNSEEMEFAISKVAIALLAQILKKNGKDEKSIYESVLDIVEKLNEGGHNVTIPECIAAILKKAVDDGEFVKNFMDELP